VDSPLIVKAALNDLSFVEEVLALAQERGWNLPEPATYAWQMIVNISDPLPRVLRVLNRDIFELDGICRETDDDDVSSLASQLRAERTALRRRIEQADPALTLPGAK
jgi:hypothetical protein